jgi:hypothetical protein
MDGLKRGNRREHITLSMLGTEGDQVLSPRPPSIPSLKLSTEAVEETVYKRLLTIYLTISDRGETYRYR